MPFSQKQINLTELDYFVESTLDKFPCHDIFKTETKINISTHTHNNFESRLFLEGSAKFCIDGVEVLCVPGTYVEIPPNTQHSFTKENGEMLSVLRFFSDANQWEPNFC